MCTEVGRCPGKSRILPHWPYSVRPKTYAQLWNHQEQLTTHGVSHPGQEILTEVTYQTVVGVRFFFWLAAAWVDPGRSALQSAEQWCKDAMVRFTRLVKSHFMTKACKGRSNNSQNKKEVSTVMGTLVYGACLGWPCPLLSS